MSCLSWHTRTRGPASVSHIASRLWSFLAKFAGLGIFEFSGLQENLGSWHDWPWKASDQLLGQPATCDGCLRELIQSVNEKNANSEMTWICRALPLRCAVFLLTIGQKEESKRKRLCRMFPLMFPLSVNLKLSTESVNEPIMSCPSGHYFLHQIF